MIYKHKILGDIAYFDIKSGDYYTIVKNKKRCIPIRYFRFSDDWEEVCNC